MAKKRPPKTAAKKTRADKTRVTLPEMRCFVACDQAGRATSSGGPIEKTFLMGMFDTVAAEHMPAAFGPCFLFIQLFGGAGTGSVSIVGTYKDGSIMTESTLPSFILKPGERGEIFAHLPFMPITQFGPIKFILAINGQQIGWPLIIMVSPATGLKLEASR